MRRWESTPLRGREWRKERSIIIFTKVLITQNQYWFQSWFVLNKGNVECELVSHYIIANLSGTHSICFIITFKQLIVPGGITLPPVATWGQCSVTD